MGPGPIDGDTHRASKAQRARFFNGDDGPFDSWVTQTEVSNFQGHFFHQEELRIFDQLDRLLGDGAIVNYSGNIIRASRTVIGVEGYIDQHILLVTLFLFVNTNDSS